MKHSCQSTIIPLLLLLLISHTFCHHLNSHQSGESSKIEPNVITLEEDDFNSLIGLKECGEKDDEACQKRRMVAEAHLDYIYTQNHKP